MQPKIFLRQLTWRKPNAGLILKRRSDPFLLAVGKSGVDKQEMCSVWFYHYPNHVGSQDDVWIIWAGKGSSLSGISLPDKTFSGEKI